MKSRIEIEIEHDDDKIHCGTCIQRTVSDYGQSCAAFKTPEGRRWPLEEDDWRLLRCPACIDATKTLEDIKLAIDAYRAKLPEILKVPPGYLYDEKDITIRKDNAIMKIFQMSNDTVWYAAETAEGAVEQWIDDDSWVEDENPTASEIEPWEYDNLTIILNDEKETQITFREELQNRIDRGESFPQLFAKEGDEWGEDY